MEIKKSSEYLLETLFLGGLDGTRILVSCGIIRVCNILFLSCLLRFDNVVSLLNIHRYKSFLGAKLGAHALLNLSISCFFNLSTIAIYGFIAL